MLVKKYEAQSIKKAIELVKMELGPEAIILGAKENNPNFGLGGGTSVEVTAAISEHKYREKIQAEKKLNQKYREKFSLSSAKNQKTYIDKAMQRRGQSQYNMPAIEESREKPVRRPMTGQRYIDIPEDEAEGAPLLTESEETSVNRSGGIAMAVPMTSVESPGSAQKLTDTTQISVLKKEISHLKGLLEKFQHVPQGFVSSHPGAEYGISYELSGLYQKLINSGVSEDNLVDLFKEADEILPLTQKKKRAFVEGWLIRQFLGKIDVVKDPSFGRYHVFVGPTAQGKTSTVVKFASHLVMRQKKKVAILSGDSVKVGARDQLKIYCQILNIPFGVIDKEVDWVALNENLKDVDHILIDTGGVNLRGSSDIDLVRRCLPRGFESDTRCHFVQSIMARDKDAFEVADRFKLFNFDDVIFTRLDEAVAFGFMYNLSKRYKVPIHSFGTGSDIPDCFEFATKERVVDLLFKLSCHQEERR